MSDKKSQEYPTEDPAFQKEEEAHHEPAEDKKEEEHLGSDDNVSKNEEEEEKPAEEAQAPGEKKEDAKPGVSAAVLIFTILNLCGLVFCATGISIGMIQNRETKACISIWGYKPKCLGAWFRHMDWDDFGDEHISCKKGDSLMQGAQAFSVMSIIGGLLTTATAFLELFHFAELAVVAAIMSFINMIAVLVVWSTMLAMYWANLCGQGVYADTYRISSGLALYITAWCCQFVANLTIVIAIGLGQAK